MRQFDSEFITTGRDWGTDIVTMTISSTRDSVDTGLVAENEQDPGARARRRTFTAEYKQRILEEYEALPSGSPDRGAMLRREGLYSSHLAEWRKARQAGTREALTPKTRGAKRTPEQVEVQRLRARTQRLEAELERTRLALEITGKAHALLEMLSESADTERKFKR
ncbi:hypothetical protein GCM10023147_52490 [Tsukamurella soli]|uniref:Transposase n=1 Tax=Tsukamurella soli TaxID=644556 RepID=A0ABP8KK85_9ACTN